jgi:hypothetical protein
MMARRVWRLGGDNAIMAVCAHARTAIFFFGAKWSEPVSENRAGNIGLPASR